MNCSALGTAHRSEHLGSPALLSQSRAPSLTFLPANVAQDTGDTAKPHLQQSADKLQKNFTNVFALANYPLSHGLLENFARISCVSSNLCAQVILLSQCVCVEYF